MQQEAFKNRIPPQKKILMIGTGGTIASKATDSGFTPLLSSEELLQYIPNIKNICEVDTIQLCNLDSTNISQEHWLLMADTIQRNYEAYDGFVICHGTDTMAYTGAALSYLIQQSPKPIVITGSQRPINMEISDSKINLYSSFLYASSGESCGVQILFDEQVILGTRARKTRSKSFHAFSSVNYPYLAVIQNDKIIRYIPQEKGEKPFFYDKLNPKVALLKLIPGMESCFLSYLLDKNDAVIIESFGVGGIPSLEQFHYYDIIKEGLRQGKTIVMTTQVPNEGSEMNIYQVGQHLKSKLDILEAYDMTTEAVTAKLMWILGQTRDPLKIRSLFYTPVSCDLLYTGIL